MIKYCPRCHGHLNTEKFGKSKNRIDGLAWACKICIAIKDKEDVPKRRTAHAAYYHKHKAQRLAGMREKVTGWSAKAFEIAWKQQHGRCAIYARKMQKTGQGQDSVVADHDHKTMATRRLLCRGCNLFLGHAQDSVEVLEKAIAYLQENT